MGQLCSGKKGKRGEPSTQIVVAAARPMPAGVATADGFSVVVESHAPTSTLGSRCVFTIGETTVREFQRGLTFIAVNPVRPGEQPGVHEQRTFDTYGNPDHVHAMVNWLAQVRSSGIAHTILIGMSDSAGGACEAVFSAAEKAATRALQNNGGYAALGAIGGTGAPFKLREPFVLIGGVGLASGEGLESRGGHGWNPEPASIRLESCVPYKVEKVLTLIGSCIEGGACFRVQCLSLGGNVECSWERLDRSMRLAELWVQIEKSVGCECRLVLPDGGLLSQTEHGEMALETLFV